MQQGRAREPHKAAVMERRAGKPDSTRKQATSRHTMSRSAIASAVTYSPDDRQALGLLMLPFLLLAFAIGSSQSLLWQPSFDDQIATPAPFARPVAPLQPGGQPGGQNAVASNQNGVASLSGRSAPVTLSSKLDAPLAAVAGSPPPGATLAPSVSSVEVPPAVTLSSEVTAPLAAQASTSNLAVATAGQPETLAPAPHQAIASVPSAPPVELAALPQDLVPPVPGSAVVPVPAQGPAPEVASNVCVATAPPASVVSPERLAALGGGAGSGYVDPIAFGMELAGAAREQLDDFTVYTDQYRSISYPNGDVPSFYGVCTDVIIRAYRVLGIDLQALVHQSKLGSGDTNIDHRRVGTLQKFFAAYGQSIPVSEFSEDYWPGDVVSYYRPQNAHSRTHIAIVSDVVGPSGNFMIIHNRGWGPQQEDGLFVDQITGHYRYSAGRRPNGAPAIASAVKPKVAADAKKRTAKPLASGNRASLAPGGMPAAGSVAR